MECAMSKNSFTIRGHTIISHQIICIVYFSLHMVKFPNLHCNKNDWISLYHDIPLILLSTCIDIFVISDVCLIFKSSNQSKVESTQMV